MIRPNPNGVSAPPCFYFFACRQHAALEKNGKSLCHGCAAHAEGREYPLRAPSRRPLYLSDRQVAEALSLIAPPRRRMRAERYRCCSLAAQPSGCAPRTIAAS